MYDICHEKNPNPTKDQHFMIDEEIIKRICETATIQQGEVVVEIGGGTGAITKYLSEYNVTVIEKDPYYAKFLQDKFLGHENVKVIFGDALDQEYNSFDRIVSNLPYTITEPFLINLARSGALYYDSKDPKSSHIKSITLVLSQNSVRKMVAPIQIVEGNSKHLNSEFGIMGAICHTFFDLEIVMVIPSEAFFPEPAVTSFLVNLTPKKKKTTVDRIMEQLLMDRKNRQSSINHVYQLMISQGKVYNVKKHNSHSNEDIFTSCTTKSIGDKNIYDLTNAQLSQLVQDLIRNDSKIKGSKASSRNETYFEREDDSFDDMNGEEEVHHRTKVQKRAFEKYAYLYDCSKYNALLHRGLEYASQAELSATGL